MEKYLENIKEANKKIQTADHLAYMTYPLVKEKRMLLTILNEIHSANLLIINSILQREYIFKRIELTKDGKQNLRIFINECSERYEINQEELKIIKEIMELGQAHKKSSIEFLRKEEVIIMSDAYEQSNLNIEKTKKFIENTKKVLLKTIKKYNYH